jgi:parallel beta-helix repeat protein
MIVVRPGTYAGFALGWEGPQSGTKEQRITFKAEPGTVIETSGESRKDGIDLENCSYVTIEGFEVRNTRGTITRAGIRAGGRGQGIVIRNNKVDGCGQLGISTSFADDVLIEGNVTSNARKEHGIYVANSCVRPVIRGNTCFGNRQCGIHVNGDASQGGNGLITEALIEKNIIYNNGPGGGSAINLDGVQRSIIRNNLLYGNHSSGVSLFRDDGADGSKNNKIVNNTIIGAADARWCLNIKGRSTGNTAFNNILLNKNTQRGSISLVADSQEGFVSDYNAVDGRFSPDDGETKLSLEDWQARTMQDKNSLRTTAAKLFVDASADNYHLAAGSPAIGVGTPRFAPEADLDGKPRPKGKPCAIGAYEFAPAGKP